MSYVWFGLVCTIWGSSFILMKRAAGGLSPLSIGAGRVLFGAAILLLVLCWLRQPRGFRWKDAGSLFGIVVTGFAWPYCVQPELISRHGSAFIGMSVGFTPLLTLGISVIALGTIPTARQVIGVAGALVCLCVLMWDGWQRAVPSTDLLLAFSVPLTYAIANNWIRRSMTHVPPIELTFLCLLGSGVLLLPLAWVMPARAATTASWEVAWGSVALLGVVGTGFATCLFNRLIQEEGPLFAAMVTNLVPLFAMAWGFADAEQISLRQLIAVMGVLLMVLLVQYGSAKKAAQG
ncbi:MAG TPA: DMT family transporter [Planctomycetaceae bacterium]|nr:DMT family transporter [Planctomycetaceae bacterium]